MAKKKRTKLPNFYTPKEVAALIGVTETTVGNWCATKAIPHMRFESKTGRRAWGIPRRFVESFLMASGDGSTHEEDPFIRIPDVAKLLNRSDQMIRDYCRSGLFKTAQRYPGEKGVWVMRQSEVDQYLGLTKIEYEREKQDG